jgi:protein tyrosine phosphatase
MILRPVQAIDWPTKLATKSVEKPSSSIGVIESVVCIVHTSLLNESTIHFSQLNTPFLNAAEKNVVDKYRYDHWFDYEPPSRSTIVSVLT